MKNLLADLSQDSASTKYLRMANSVSFDEMCSYSLELPVSDHWRPDVKIAKKNEPKNLSRSQR